MDENDKNQDNAPERLLDIPYWSFEDAVDVAVWKYCQKNIVEDGEKDNIYLEFSESIHSFLNKKTDTNYLVIDINEYKDMASLPIYILIYIFIIACVVFVCSNFTAEDIFILNNIGINNLYDYLFIIIIFSFVSLCVVSSIFLRNKNKIIDYLLARFKISKIEKFLIRNNESLTLYSRFQSIEIIEFLNQKFKLDLPINPFVFWKQPFWKRRGQVWIIGFAGKVICVDEKSCKVVGQIAQLINSPHKRFDPVTLTAKTDADAIGKKWDPEEKAEYLNFTRRMNNAAPDFFVALKIKHAQEGLLKKAQDIGDIDAVNKASDELKFINRYISDSFTPKGKEKVSGRPEEKTEDNFRKAVERFILKTKKDHPELSEHLRNNTMTGQEVSYSPKEEIAWDVTF